MILFVITIGIAEQRETPYTYRYLSFIIIIIIIIIIGQSN